jgi:hypothetical protein
LLCGVVFNVAKQLAVSFIILLARIILQALPNTQMLNKEHAPF